MSYADFGEVSSAYPVEDLNNGTASRTIVPTTILDLLSVPARHRELG
jgi:hypothetical protein